MCLYVCSYSREHISLWTGVFNICCCFCWFELGLTACGNTVVHAHITYVLKSCCFSLFPISSPLSLSADLPSVPPSLHLSAPFVRPSPSPPAERTVCGAQRQKKARQTQDLTERIQRPPGPSEQQHERTLPLENRESTRICMHRHTQNKVTHILFPIQSRLLLF